MLRKIIVWAVILFAVFYVATEPGSAAGALHGLTDHVHGAVNSLARFVASL